MFSNYVQDDAEAEDGSAYSVGGRGGTSPSRVNAAMKQPSAGLPDAMGSHVEGPEMLSNYVLDYAEAEDGLVYSVGGRGRTFPSHINAAMKQPQRGSARRHGRSR